MSRKDFVAIAAIINSRADSTKNPETMRRRIALDLATHLATTNPRFNRARFLDACGVQE